MDPFTALVAAGNYNKLAKAGFQVKDGTSTALGTEYQKLHGDVNFVHCTDAGINEKDDAKAPILSNRPELGTLWQPDVDELLKVCTASKFGHGNQTVLDPTVRQSVELVFGPDDLVSPDLTDIAYNTATALFVTPVQEANTEREDYIEEYAPKIAYESKYAHWGAKETREPNNASLKRRCQWLEDRGLMKPLQVPKITVEPDKLVIYRPGDHFDEHRDTVRAVNHIGTVVITLPNPTFTGGGLEFPTENVIHSDPNEVVAFYTDVRHRVNPVETGTRISITFRVFLTNSDEAKLPPSPRLYECNDTRRDMECDDGLGSWGRHEAEHAGLPGTAEMFPDGSTLCKYPKFADGKFVNLLRAELSKPFAEDKEEDEEEDEEDEEEEESPAKKPKQELKKKRSVVLGCVHMVPAAALQPGANIAESLRGIDKQVAESLQAIGFKIELVTVRVVTSREVYDGCDPNDVSRKIRVYANNNLTDALFLRALALDAITLEHKSGADYTGNESAPDILTYMCAGMAVSL